MKHGILGAAALFLTAWPLAAGTLFTGLINPTQPAATNTGVSVGAGQSVHVTVTGTMDLLGNDGVWATHPDGSLVNPLSSACGVCFTSFYAAYANVGSPYPQTAGGDGVNHFAGGGANIDLDSGASTPWAPEGKHTTDTLDSDPHVLRLGSIAYTFVASPTALDWLLLGNGGDITNTTAFTGTLKVVVVDTAYWNNTGGFTVTVADIAAVPEPSAVWLSFSGIALAGLARIVRRRRNRS
jgi:hypothetical protein